MREIETHPLGTRAPEELNYQPRFKIYFESQKFITKIADNLGEIFGALKLRHAIFYEEMIGTKSKTGIDMDEFDYDSDHLILVDKATGSIVGTYRLRSSQFVTHFYSHTEFDLSRLLQENRSRLLELGRACLHPDFRNGVAINNLWTGISQYIRASQTDILMGCSTVKTTDHQTMIQIYHHLKDAGSLVESYGIHPFNDGGVRYNDCSLEPGLGTPKMVLPPLLEFYLRIGAKAIGAPAFDPDFHCFDFFTLLNIQEIPERIARRYGLKGP